MTTMNDGQIECISTERLLLRPFSKSDREAVLDLYSDSKTMRYWSKEPISSLEEADALIDHLPDVFYGFSTGFEDLLSVFVFKRRRLGHSLLFLMAKKKPEKMLVTFFPARS